MNTQRAYFVFDKLSQLYWVGGHGSNAEFSSRTAKGAMPLINCQDENQAQNFITKIGINADSLYFEEVSFQKIKGENGISGEDVDFFMKNYA